MPAVLRGLSLRRARNHAGFHFSVVRRNDLGIVARGLKLIWKPSQVGTGPNSRWLCGLRSREVCLYRLASKEADCALGVSATKGSKGEHPQTAAIPDLPSLGDYNTNTTMSTANLLCLTPVISRQSECNGGFLEAKGTRFLERKKVSSREPERSVPALPQKPQEGTKAQRPSLNRLRFLCFLAARHIRSRLLRQALSSSFLLACHR